MVSFNNPKGDLKNFDFELMGTIAQQMIQKVENKFGAI
jgi:hypothetical protein